MLRLVTQLSEVEVLECDCTDLERMLSNESHDKNRDITRSKKSNNHCKGAFMENKNNLITEPESTVVKNDDCAFSIPSGTMKKTIGKITYVANIHFKNEG